MENADFREGALGSKGLGLRALKQGSKAIQVRTIDRAVCLAELVGVPHLIVDTIQNFLMSPSVTHQDIE